MNLEDTMLSEASWWREDRRSDSTSVRSLACTHSWRQKVGRCFPRGGGTGKQRCRLMQTEFQFENLWDRRWPTNARVPDAAEHHTENGEEGGLYDVCILRQQRPSVRFKHSFQL